MTTTIEDLLNNLSEIYENDELEFKGAKGGLPKSFWETYSAFANTNGGVVILGISEKHGMFKLEHLTDIELNKLKKDLWSGLENNCTTNINLLNNNDVYVHNLGDANVLVIKIPRAGREQRPVYIGLNPYNGTYKRGYEGDFKCTRSEVQRMFADADLTLTTDKRILKGYSIDDIDKESLRQYRQLFNIAKPEHIWSTLSDMDFLKQLGAYRRDRRTGEEGFTVAGILMFGKGNSITDDECLPNFFPDFRNETSLDGISRWIDRIYPDGTWEANLFQFYIRTLPRLQSFLPKPFTLAGSQRIDQSPAHIAIREVFVNLCVHPDYKAEGSLTVIYNSGTYHFSNPGTMLVSQEQFFEGGESICRNPTLQKMFMMLGPAEKAGSGGAKIMEGWRKNNWKAPFVSERSRPDKVEIWLSMQSLIQPEILEELNQRLGVDVKAFTSNVQTILTLALTEKHISNERLRYILRLHKSDITTLLQQLCKKGLLVSDGYGRGTKYSLPPCSTVPISQDNPESEAKEGSLGAKEGSLGAKEGSLGAKEGSLDTRKVPLSDTSKSFLSKKRLNKKQMEYVICEITAQWRTPQEISDIIGKEIKYLKDKIIPTLIANGILVREFPNIPNHPNQRYRHSVR